MASIKYQELAHGMAYTLSRLGNKDLTIIFPYGLTPRVLFGDREVPIVRPFRFGNWDTPSDRRAYVYRFNNGTEA